MGLKKRKERPKAQCRDCHSLVRLFVDGTVGIHSAPDGKFCFASHKPPRGKWPDGFKAATFYWITGQCGSLALYYKVGQPKQMHVVMSSAEVAAADDSKLSAKLKLSDKFAEQKGIPVDPRTPQQIFEQALWGKMGKGW